MSSQDSIVLDEPSDAPALAVSSQSSITAQPTTFARFPTEMVELISSNLESFEDFSNFRLSSRKTWIESSDSFVEKFFVHKRILWTEHALNAFADMAAFKKLFSTLFRKLEHLTFCAPPLLKKFDEDIARHFFESWAFPQALEYNQFCDQHLSFTRKRWNEGLHCLRTFFQSFNKQHQNIGLSFEGLAHGKIYEWSPQDRPAWGVAHFMRYHTLVEPILRRELYRSEDNPRTSARQENMLGMVLESISSAHLDVVFLNLDKQWANYSYNILLEERFFAKLLTRLPRLETCFRNLHTLRLKVNVHWRHMTPPHPNFERGLTRFWSACPRLRIFRFEAECEEDHGNTFLEKCLRLLRSEGLEDLEIENSICNSDDICAVLRRHRSTLKRVRFATIDLSDEDEWELVLAVLQGLPRLERLSISNMTFHDDQDFFYLITFPDLSWLEKMAVGPTEEGDVEAAKDQVPDTTDASDDHQDNEDEDVEFTDSINMDREQIIKLFPLLILHLTCEELT